MAYLEIKDISKSFGGKKVLDQVSFSLEKGDFFSLLGESGCGKTTLLRIIAGLENADSGHIILEGTDITYTPPQYRNIGVVFQNYALFPHLSVFENIAFGLKLKIKSGPEVRAKVEQILEKVKLADKINKLVTQLSGGEQQRVSLARVMVMKPQLILFDEPVSNLDYSLRLKARNEIKRLQNEVGISSLYVTHDQSEALALSNKIAVLHAGKVMQIATPQELYFNPSNFFAANFVGHFNFFNPQQASTLFNFPIQADEVLGILPEHLIFSKSEDKGIEIDDIIFSGLFLEYIISINGHFYKAITTENQEHAFQKGDTVTLSAHLANFRLIKTG